MFELLLGIRYLKAKRKQAFISVITLISALGVMVGVMALVVVLSVMNGFRADLMSKILGVNSHVLILNYGGAFEDYEEVAKKVSGVNDVVASTPFIYTQVMVKKSGNVTGAVLRGIDPKTAGKVVNIEKMLKEGSLISLEGRLDGVPSIIVGSELSRQIGAYPGDILTVVSPEGKLTPLGRAPNSRQYRVTAVFDSGMYEYDATMVFISIKEAQDFLIEAKDYSMEAVTSTRDSRHKGWRTRLGAFLSFDWRKRPMMVIVKALLALALVVGAGSGTEPASDPESRTGRTARGFTASIAGRQRSVLGYAS